MVGNPSRRSLFVSKNEEPVVRKIENVVVREYNTVVDKTEDSLKKSIDTLTVYQATI